MTFCRIILQEEVKLHASDAKELGSAHERLTELDRSCLQLKHQVKDLERETGRAREERKEELSSVRKRMEQAERHAEFLSEENSRYRDQIVALSRSPGEESQQVLAEMKKAREIGELERRRLELQKTQVEEDVRALRAENQSLREQLANQQSENWRLQKDCQLETQSRAKLLQIDMIEDENCRLEADNKSMKQKLEEAEKRANATTNPYVKQLEDEKKRTQELEKEAKSQKGQAEEWKSMYEACKFKEEDIKRWEAQQAELKSKVTSLEEKATSLQAKLEAEQKACKEEQSKVQELTKAREDLQSSLKSKGEEYDKQASNLKAVQNLKQLHTKRIHDLEAQSKTLQEENKRLKTQAATQADAEDMKQIQKHADTGLHLAIEYRTALEAVLSEVEKMHDARPPATSVPKAGQQESGEAKPDAKEVEKTKEAQPAASPQSTPKDAPTPKEPPAEISAKRKETASQQLGQVVERAAKSARSGEGAPVKKLPVAPKAGAPGQTVLAPAPKATGESTAASPSLTPRASPPAHIVVDVDEEPTKGA